MKLTACFALLGSLAAALPSDLALRAPSPLKVKLELSGNTLIKATFTNTGKKNLRLFKDASILDNIPVKKVEVFSEGKPAEFQGIYARVDSTLADESSFRDLASGSSLKTSFDVAELYDLSQGGKFTIQAEGIISYADNGGNTLVGSVGYAANSLDIEVDGAEASKVHANSVLHQKRTNEKRTVVQGDCTGSKRDLISVALYMCAIYAENAWRYTFSTESDAKMLEYFKRSDADAKLYVANGFLKASKVCGSADSGDTKIFCSDIYNSCGGTVFAYAQPRDSNLVFCQLYFDYPVTKPGGCHDSDSGTTLLHEVTHLSQTLGTADYDTYRYDALRKLTAEQNINHADTYTYYAQALVIPNC